MIYDRLNNAAQYYSLGEKIKKGFEFLANSNLSELKEGRYEIEGDEIYANVQTLETKPECEKKWEVHRKYIDIQYIIKGREKMGYGILEDFTKIVSPYDEKTDAAFLDGEQFNFINIPQGDFVIFFPNDVHAPMLAIDKPEEIKKVIVKIAV